ncbi:MAG: hypothetical protein ABIP64_00590 [Burkholderiales bacterium]
MKHWAYSLVTALLVISLGGDGGCWAQDLSYQKRGNRNEGIKAKPVSGFDIELLAAQGSYGDETDKLGERFYARFYLERPSPVFLTVRELDYKYYYWLDNIEHKGRWQAGFDNVFDWPTKDVVSQLGNLRISDLGVVARLDSPQPRAIEKIAPVIFYQSQTPANIEGYQFAFKLREDAKVKAVVYKETSDEGIVVQPLAPQRGGRPFWIKWNLSNATAPEGAYKLVVSGYLLSTNDPLNQVVRFYHQPRLK